MVELANNMNGQSVGTVVTAANSGGASGDAWNQVAKGTGAGDGTFGTDSAGPALDINLVSATTWQVIWNGRSFSQTRVCFYMTLPAVPTAAMRVLEARDTASVVMLRLIANSTGKFLLQSNGGANVAKSFGTSLLANTRYRVEMVWTKGTSGATLKMDYYIGESTTPVEAGCSSTTENLASANNTGEIRFGSIASTNTMTGHMKMGHFRAGDTSQTYYGPYNTPPTANVGPDQTVNPFDRFDIDASGSSDPDGTIASYAFSSPTLTFLAGVDSAHVYGYAPASDVQVVHTVTLTVTDNVGATSTDTMTITVPPCDEFYWDAAGNLKPLDIQAL